MVEYILIVDDFFPLRQQMQEALSQSGYRSRTASNGWECLRIARSADKPSLILLDHKMPDITGIEVLLALKKDAATREIPVIMARTPQKRVRDSYINTKESWGQQKIHG